MDDKFKHFEDRIQTAAQIAQDAMDEMEKWRRKRVSLAQEIWEKMFPSDLTVFFMGPISYIDFSYILPTKFQNDGKFVKACHIWYFFAILY